MQTIQVNGFPLNVFFNAGQVEQNYDELIVLDSDGVTNLNSATPYGSNGDLTGITYQSSGDTITIMIDSDSVISCETNDYIPWDFDIWCQTCINPTVTFSTDGDCINGNDFLRNIPKKGNIENDLIERYAPNVVEGTQKLSIWAKKM